MVIDFRKTELQLGKYGCSDYIVLDAKEFQFMEDKRKFEESIEVLNIVKTVHWINEFYKKSHSDLKIDTSIIYKVIDAGYTGQSFNDEELTAYYNAMVLIDNFNDSMMKFKDFDERVPVELDFLLFGFSFEEQGCLTNKQTDELRDSFFELSCDVLCKKIEVKTFIEKTKTLINDFKKIVNDKLSKKTK